MADEDKTLLIAYLNSARHHVGAALDGVSDSDLRRPILPSGWSMLGLVQHLALDVERFWFPAVMLGAEVPLCEGAEAWQVASESTMESVRALYETECAQADEIIGGLPLDAQVTWWPTEWGPCGIENLRDVILHVIVETATHAGHLDVARELIDGHQHLVMT